DAFLCLRGGHGLTLTRRPDRSRARDRVLDWKKPAPGTAGVSPADCQDAGGTPTVPGKDAVSWQTRSATWIFNIRSPPAAGADSRAPDQSRAASPSRRVPEPGDRYSRCDAGRAGR